MELGLLHLLLHPTPSLTTAQGQEWLPCFVVLPGFQAAVMFDKVENFMVRFAPSRGPASVPLTRLT